LVCCSVFAQGYRNKLEAVRVVGVSDGDTITVLDRSNNQHKIRLAGIDAPESRQAFGERAKQQLSDLVFGKTVTVLFDKQDRYGRTVGKVLFDGVDVNLAMLRAGMAWFYRAYASEQPVADQADYAAGETEAREAVRGLWGDAKPTAPWAWRRGERGDSRVRTTTPENAAPRTQSSRYIRGPRGGCYYLSGSGRKVYVDRSLCN
jgi:endonuclease YncB( thermonuclease family)